MNRDICYNKKCCHHDPDYLEKCEALISPDECVMAIFEHPVLQHIRLALAWFDKYSLHIALIMTAIALILFLAFISWLRITSPSEIAFKQAQQDYFDQINKEQSTDRAKRAFQRLWIYHGRPTSVIYEPGKTPYFIDTAGKKCKFVMKGQA
jgi:hypothetical protein